jgi:hypothetical protein
VRTFEQFRAELAKAEPSADSGMRIGKASVCGKQNCPLSLHPDHPRGAIIGADQAAELWGISEDNAREFIAGFDTSWSAAEYFDGRRGASDTPYFQLGRAYRARFVEGR